MGAPHVHMQRSRAFGIRRAGQGAERTIISLYFPIIAVSYTHLDVYKRQPCDSACVFQDCEAVKGKTTLETMESLLREIDLKGILAAFLAPEFGK